MKTYKKPEIYFEHFELAEHIAGCNFELTDLDARNCTASGMIEDWNSSSWFVNGNALCKQHVNDYCYSNNVTEIATINS